MFQEELGVRQGVQVRIKKKIPVAAGLAGGSSNAATALVGLNKIWKLNLTHKELLSYARRLGSDVAFFLHDCRWAFGTGRGDQIEKLDVPQGLWHIIVVPRIRMYSWKVYGGFKLPVIRPQQAAGNVPKKIRSALQRGGTNVLTKKSDDVSIFIHHLRNNNILEMEKRMVNDLEGSIIHLCRRLEKVKQKLKSLGAQGVMISGSGPAVFGIASTQKEVQRMRSVLSRRFSQVFAVRTF